MSYRVKRFNFPISPTGVGTNIANIINEFFALNNFITPVGLTVNWKTSSRRAGQVFLNLFYRVAGVRHWSYLFSAPDEATVAANIQAYFAANPLFCPVLMTNITPPSLVGEHISILVIYQAVRDLIRSARPGVYPNYAPFGGNVAIGDFGDFRSVVDFSAPPVTAMNLGLQVWQQGRPGILFSSIDACPDGEGFKLGGVSLCCGDSGALAAAALTYYPDCGCGGAILGLGGGGPPPTGPTTTRATITPPVPPVTTPPTTTTRSTTPPVTTNTPPVTSTYPTYPPTTNTPPVTYPPPPPIPAFFGRLFAGGGASVPNFYYSTTGETNDGTISMPNPNHNIYVMWSDGTKLYALAYDTVAPNHYFSYESLDAITWTLIEDIPSLSLNFSPAALYDKAVDRSFVYSFNNAEQRSSTGPASGFIVRLATRVHKAVMDGSGVLGTIENGSPPRKISGGSYPYTTRASAFLPNDVGWISYGSDIAYGNGIWVAIGYDFKAGSDDRLRTWTGATPSAVTLNPTILAPPAGTIEEKAVSMVFGNGVFLAVTLSYSSPITLVNSHILRSTDGLSWTRVYTDLKDYGMNTPRLAYHDGLKRFLWANAYETLYSDDNGASWSTGASNIQNLAESSRPMHVV